MVDLFGEVLEEARKQVPLEPVPEPSVIENWPEIERVLPAGPTAEVPVAPPVAEAVWTLGVLQQWQELREHFRCTPAG